MKDNHFLEKNLDKKYFVLDPDDSERVDEKEEINCMPQHEVKSKISHYYFTISDQYQTFFCDIVTRAEYGYSLRRMIP